MERSRKDSESRQGYIYAILGSVCAGSVSTLTKISLTTNGPLVVTGVTFLLSGLVLLLYQPRRKPEPGSYRYLILFGLLGAGLAPLMYTLGLNQTTVVNASLLANGEVLFTTVIAFAVFGERLGRGQAARGILIVAGLLVVSTNLDLAHIAFLHGLAGNLLILGSGAGWAVENNIIVLATKRFDTTLLSKYRNLIGGCALTALFLIGRFPYGFSAYSSAVMLLLALAVSGATVMFIAAVKRLGAIRMLLVWSTSTVFGALFGLVILGEQITAAQIFGGALILFGVYLLRSGDKVPEAEPFVAPAGGP
ncbi:MAG: DMT family transporter [Nitrososphaerota archaeon]|nr:DMT family transporter [Nitrososphaerota archaeon]MDG6941631.1 DMT family transporter [Nitrososphaerota archaeon]MDG6947195.1 DMT family transporter [Nitrososphaerota archaeon]MDG6951227.1 DMT family transporter [Nitrososphaerota archaeon]